MSIRIMSAVWEKGPAKQSERFVLLALADYANDQGECWPSLDGVAARVCMDVRSVRRILRRLEADGWLETQVGGGRSGCNSYRINPDPVSEFGKYKPGPSVPPDTESPRTLDAETRTLDALNPDPESPEPSRTIIEPSIEEPPLDPPERKRRAVQLPEDWVPNDRNIEDAIQRKFTEQEIDHEAEQFKNYHVAKGTRFIDWDAGWRTWLGNARKFGNRRMAGPSHTRGGGSGRSMASIAARNRGFLPV